MVEIVQQVQKLLKVTERHMSAQILQYDLISPSSSEKQTERVDIKTPIQHIVASVFNLNYTKSLIKWNSIAHACKFIGDNCLILDGKKLYH